jgi:uncharacterized protein (DUF2062 family)
MIKRVKLYLKTQLLQGISPNECSRAVATALTIGVFPILGFSTLMNTACAHRWRLNQAIVHSLNWLCGPLKIALIVPFLRFGEFLFQAEPFALSLAEFSRRFDQNSAATVVEFSWTFIHAILGWLCCAPIIYLALNYTTQQLLRYWRPIAPQHRPPAAVS